MRKQSKKQHFRRFHCFYFRSQENGQKSELSPHPDRVVKTSEDQYVRPDSSSSQSSVENESPSAKSNAHHHHHHPPTLKPDFNRVRLCCCFFHLNLKNFPFALNFSFQVDSSEWQSSINDRYDTSSGSNCS